MPPLFDIVTPLATLTATTIAIAGILVIITASELSNWYNDNTNRDGSFIVLLYALTTGTIVTSAGYYTGTYIFTPRIFIFSMMLGLTILVALAFLGALVYHTFKDVRAALTTINTNP